MKPNYKKAYNILMDELWDIVPDENREYLDKKLKECGL
jgi:hypothetical protein